MTRVKFNGGVNGLAFAEAGQFESGWRQIVRDTMYVWLNGRNGGRRRVKST